MYHYKLVTISTTINFKNNINLYNINIKFSRICYVSEHQLELVWWTKYNSVLIR